MTALCTTRPGTRRRVSALVLLHTLTSDVNRAGLGRLADIPNSHLQGPLLRWYMRHMPRRHQQRFLYVRGQFGCRWRRAGASWSSWSPRRSTSSSVAGIRGVGVA
jgi:hypothetical protein